MTRISAAEKLWILFKNETKPWLREVTIVTVSNRIEHKCRALGYAGHSARLQAIHTHWRSFFGVWETADGIDSE